MADKQVTVAVPEERVPEFYAWFAAFLTSEPGAPPEFGGRGRRGRRGSHRHGDAQPWTPDDAEQAAWLYRKLACPGRYSRHLGRVLPIATEGRADGGTDYYMDPETAELFRSARERSSTRS